MDIKRNGAQASAKGPAEYFTDTVRIDAPFKTTALARVSGATVTFEFGQALIVTFGCGRVQREGGSIEKIRAGDIVWLRPGEKHSRSAAPDTAMSHIAIAEAHDGKVVQYGDGQ
jgi:quercetin dioxygenase-like cupin family protein